MPIIMDKSPTEEIWNKLLFQIVLDTHLEITLPLDMWNLFLILFETQALFLIEYHAN